MASGSAADRLRASHSEAVYRRNHHAHVVAEFFEAIQDAVHGAGLERNGPDDAVRQIELSRARQIQEHRNLARQMIRHADDLRLLVQQLGVRRDLKSLPGEADQRGPAQDRQRLHRLTHGERQADQFQRDIHAAPARQFLNLLDGIAG